MAGAAMTRPPTRGEKKGCRFRARRTSRARPRTAARSDVDLLEGGGAPLHRVRDRVTACPRRGPPPPLRGQDGDAPAAKARRARTVSSRARPRGRRDPGGAGVGARTLTSAVHHGCVRGGAGGCVAVAQDERDPEQDRARDPPRRDPLEEGPYAPLGAAPRDRTRHLPPVCATCKGSGGCGVRSTAPRSAGELRRTRPSPTAPRLRPLRLLATRPRAARSTPW